MLHNCNLHIAYCGVPAVLALWKWNLKFHYKTTALLERPTLRLYRTYIAAWLDISTSNPPLSSIPTAFISRWLYKSIIICQSSDEGGELPSVLIKIVVYFIWSFNSSLTFIYIYQLCKPILIRRVPSIIHLQWRALPQAKMSPSPSLSSSLRTATCYMTSMVCRYKGKIVVLTNSLGP